MEVAGVARKTVQDVIEGFELLKQNVQKLAEIRAANETTYEGIKKLGEKISGISDIAFIINSIADQTNIIASNQQHNRINKRNPRQNCRNPTFI